MKKLTHIELLVSANRIRLEDIPKFKIGLKVTNSTSEYLPFDVSKTTLLVNLKRSYAWDLTVQNGTIVNMKIPPNKSETVQWPLGEALFEEPGIYELELIFESFAQMQKVIVS
jgi:hypothetical protein